MLDLLNSGWKFLLIPLFAVAFFVVALLFFYRGIYTSPSSPDLSADQVALPSSSFSEAAVPPAAAGMAQGDLLVDAAHSNDFTEQEVAALLSRVAGLGYGVEFAGSFTSMSEPQRLDLLEEKLSKADSFLVILPEDPYGQEEVALVKRFVDKGGRLVLIADPTRTHEINSLAEEFGITFQPDYLYNLEEYDLNFQNILVRDFQADELTSGLGEIVLYTAGSVQSSGPGLALTGGGVRSSLSSAPGLNSQFSPIVKGGRPNVLAISDLTFMIPPQIAIRDNGRLVDNLARYLSSGQRQFGLAATPHLFKGEVDIVVDRATLVGAGTDLKSLLAAQGIDAEVSPSEDPAVDTVYLGLHQDAPQVRQHLEAVGVSVADSIHTPFTPALDSDDHAIIVLNRVQDRQVLIVLAPSAGALASVVGQIGDGSFRDGLVDDVVGVYPSS